MRLAGIVRSYEGGGGGGEISLGKFINSENK